jgi:Replication protein C N-terminal domain/Replication protein C C-terminal region
MPTESTFGAPRGSYAGAPTGFRRLTLGLLQADRAAEHFDGLPEGVEAHGQLLAAFKAAAPRLGLSIRLIHALDWLFRFTQPQDWDPGRRPIVWPSASMQQEAFGLSENGVRHLNRGLIDAGLITMKDSPNGKRYGMRDREGDIVEAYGFDLSPIATRYAQFVRLAAEAKAEREMIGRLRRRPDSPDPAQQVGRQGTEDALSWQGSTGKSGTTAEPEVGQKDQQRNTPPGRTDSGTVMRLSIDELMHLAPRLRTYLKSPRPAWPEIVDAADWLRGELGISRSLWGDACVAMGRERAAIAIAIVSAKPAEHFRSTPGGYFNGMVVKAKAGELNLERTIWGLRQAADASQSRRKHGPGSGSSSSPGSVWS